MSAPPKNVVPVLMQGGLLHLEAGEEGLPVETVQAYSGPGTTGLIVYKEVHLGCTLYIYRVPEKKSQCPHHLNTKYTPVQNLEAQNTLKAHQFSALFNCSKV